MTASKIRNNAVTPAKLANGSNILANGGILAIDDAGTFKTIPMDSISSAGGYSSIYENDTTIYTYYRDNTCFSDGCTNPDKIRDTIDVTGKNIIFLNDSLAQPYIYNNWYYEELYNVVYLTGGHDGQILYIVNVSKNIEDLADGCGAYSGFDSMRVAYNIHSYSVDIENGLSYFSSNSSVPYVHQSGCGVTLAPGGDIAIFMKFLGHWIMLYHLGKED